MWLNQFETEQYGTSRRGRLFFEPLKTKAPKAGVKPYCCLVDQVIFHAYPYYTVKDGSRLVEYDRCTHQWNMFGERFMDGESWNCIAPLVIHDGVVYELGGGRVIRRKGQWCMEWLGWKVGQSDWRWFFIEKKMQEVLNA
jgi:hypothetical protein